jgi:hypothetical protein
MTTPYGGPTDLIEAFVNDNITEGWTIHNEMDIIVHGNTVYVYEKSSAPTTKFVQIAIRIPDNVFILNRFRTGKGTITNLTESTITKSIRGKYIYMRLNPVRYKTDNGDVDPATLRETILNINQPGAYPIRKALKTYGRDRMQEEAIENFRQLQISTDMINIPDKALYRGLAITAAIKEIKRAKKVCRMVDKYLDVLKQFPEPEP